MTHATEMGVTETLELREGLRRELGRELDAVIVNGTLPRRFEGEELRRIARLGGGSAAGEVTPARNGAAPSEGSTAGDGHSDTRAGVPLSGGATATDAAAVTASAVRTAHAVHERARTQQRQIARLRRDEGPHGSPPVLRVPFLFRPELDLEAIRRIANRLARDL